MSDKISVNDGKYTVVIHDDGCLEALRYGEPWRDLTGDHLVCSLAVELKNAREEIAKLKELMRPGIETKPYFRGCGITKF